MSKIKYYIGVFFIILGIAANRIVLEKFVSPYAIVELNYRIPIILINLSLITLGLFFISVKKEYFVKDKILNIYRFIAVNFLGALLLFVIVNVCIYSYLVIRDVGFYKNQIFFSYNKPLNEIYPDFMGREINLLLYETWSRPYVYEPYTQFKEREFKGKYVNVHDNGFRITKNQGPWPPDSNNCNVFLFGGSTTFGYGVSDNQTIASYLQANLLSGRDQSRPYCVYNFGRGNYFSTQERILFEQLIISGYTPDIAIFVDGLNDFYYFNNEPLFTERFRKFVDFKGKTLLVDLPLVNVVRDIKKVGDIEHDKKNEDYDDPILLKAVVDRYTKNKKLIETVANSFKVKTIFVWQPVPTYKYDLKYHIFAGRGFGRFLFSKYGYVYMEDYVKKNEMGKNFLWLADIQQNVKKPLYVDIDHYSAELSEKIAKRLYNFLSEGGYYRVK